MIIVGGTGSGVEYWLRYAIFFFAAIQATLLHSTPRTNKYFKTQNSRKGEKEAEEKGAELSDKVETHRQRGGRANTWRQSKSKIHKHC